jgi:hypothetical protein
MGSSAVNARKSAADALRAGSLSIRAILIQRVPRAPVRTRPGLPVRPISTPIHPPIGDTSLTVFFPAYSAEGCPYAPESCYFHLLPRLSQRTPSAFATKCVRKPRTTGRQRKRRRRSPKSEQRGKPRDGPTQQRGKKGTRSPERNAQTIDIIPGRGVLLG